MDIFISITLESNGQLSDQVHSGVVNWIVEGDELILKKKKQDRIVENFVL